MSFQTFDCLSSGQVQRHLGSRCRGCEFAHGRRRGQEGHSIRQPRELPPDSVGQRARGLCRNASLGSRGHLGGMRRHEHVDRRSHQRGEEAAWPADHGGKPGRQEGLHHLVGEAAEVQAEVVLGQGRPALGSGRARRPRRPLRHIRRRHRPGLCRNARPTGSSESRSRSARRGAEADHSQRRCGIARGGPPDRIGRD